MDDSLCYTAAAGFEAARRLDTLHGHSFRARFWAVAGQMGGAEPLHAQLAEALAPLRAGDLNALLDHPDDLALAHWLFERLRPRALALRSAPDRGVSVHDGAPVLWRAWRIEAAHRLPHVPPGHKCGRMHGHGFEIVLHARLAADGAPTLAQRLAGAWEPLRALLDGGCLNDVAGLENPTSEVLAAWIWARLRQDLPELAAVDVHETLTSGCRYDGADYRIWKDLHFESAVALAPDVRGRRRLHGHSYRLRLHLGAPLDAVMGWTVDYGDVKACFAPVYERLDHHALHELPQGGGAGLGELAAWIHAQARPELPALDALELHETPARGVLLTPGRAGTRILPSLPL